VATASSGSVKTREVADDGLLLSGRVRPPLLRAAVPARAIQPEVPRPPPLQPAAGGKMLRLGSLQKLQEMHVKLLGFEDQRRNQLRRVNPQNDRSALSLR